MKSVSTTVTAKKYDFSVIGMEEILVISHLASHIYQSLNDSDLVWELSTDDQQSAQKLCQNLMRL